MAYCFLSMMREGIKRECDTDCVMYKHGCLMKRACQTYIDVNKPIKVPTSKVELSEEEIVELIRLMKDAITPAPSVYEEGGDWFGYGANDIAP